MKAKIRAMKVAVRRMMYAVSLLGVACSHQTRVEAPYVETRLEYAFCRAAISCPGDSPTGKLAIENMVNGDTTLDGCLEIGEELRDAVGPAQATEWAARLSSNPCNG